MNVHSSMIHNSLWKQSKRPSTNEWINQWYIYKMEYYSAIEKNETLIHATMCKYGK